MPPSHGVQDDAPDEAANEPGEHGEGATEPVEHALPAGHGEHWDGAERSVALEYLQHERESAQHVAMHGYIKHRYGRACPSRTVAARSSRQDSNTLARTHCSSSH